MSTEWPTLCGSAERPRSARGDAVRGNAIYTELAELAERIGDRWNGAIALNNLGDAAFSPATGSGPSSSAAEAAPCAASSGTNGGWRSRSATSHSPSVQLGRLSSAASSVRVALDASMKIDAKTVVNWVPRRLRWACGRAGKDARGSTSRRGDYATAGGAGLGPATRPREAGSSEAVESIRASLGADAEAEI